MVTVNATVLGNPVEEFALNDETFEIFITWVPFVTLLYKDKPVSFAFMYTEGRKGEVTPSTGNEEPGA